MSTGVKNKNNGKLEAKYPKVYKAIRKQIENGLLTGALPGVKQLALEYDVNFMTVNKAVKKLEADGLVYRIPRKGTYVKRQYCVAVCFNDPNPEIMAVPVYHRVVMAAQRYFSSQGSPMYLEGSLLHEENVVNILRNRIDGLLLFLNENFPMPKDLLRLPCVRVMGSEDSLSGIDHIGYKNSKIGTIAGEYLLERGCKNAAYIGPFRRGLFDERINTFKSFLAANGSKYYEFPADWNHDFASVEKQVFQMLGMEKLPDGIFCPSDDIMANVCTILYRNGIMPDKDIKIIACNNSGPMMNSTPDVFASIELRSGEIGRLGAERLLQRIVNPKMPAETILLEPQLVVPEDNERSINKIAIEV